MNDHKKIIVKTSVPGKTLISGEYSILEGSNGLSFAVDKRLNCYVSYSKGIKIKSNFCNFEEIYKNYNDIKIKNDKFDILRNAVHKALINNDLNNVSIEINSEIDPSYGIGSSSALIISIISSLRIYKEIIKKGDKFKNKDLMSLEKYLSDAKVGFNWQRENQKRASGYDFLTEVVGGFVAFESGIVHKKDIWLYEFNHINTVYDKNKYFRLYVGGKGAPTTSTTNRTYAQLKEKNLFISLKKINDKITNETTKFINNYEIKINNFLYIIKDTFKEHLNIISETDGKLPEKWVSHIISLEGFEKSFNFKSTGAGGEDALLFIGDFDSVPNLDSDLKKIGLHRLDCSIACEGIYSEILNMDKK